MVSDEERREAAGRLRGYVSEWRDMPNFSVQKGVACSLGIVRFDVESQLLRLADLIYSSDMSQGRRDIVACDRDALLALEDEMFEDATGLAFISQLEKNEELQDLQSTMAKALMDYARRIRDALGVCRED